MLCLNLQFGIGGAFGMPVGVDPTGKVVVAPSWGWVVIVPGPKSESGSAVGLMDGRDHETEGRELKVAEVAAEDVTPLAAGTDVATEPKAATEDAVDTEDAVETEDVTAPMTALELVPTGAGAGA